MSDGAAQGPAGDGENVPTGQSGPITRESRDELALILFHRMLSRRPVWVDSPARQMTWIQMIALDEDGEVVAFDKDGNDRRCESYLLAGPRSGGDAGYAEWMEGGMG